MLQREKSFLVYFQHTVSMMQFLFSPSLDVIACTPPFLHNIICIFECFADSYFLFNPFYCLIFKKGYDLMHVHVGIL